MQIKAVIFDRDHTLVAFDRRRLAAVEARMREIAPALPAAAAQTAWASWPGPWPRHPADEPHFWQRFWQQLGAAHELPAAAVAALIAEVGPLYHELFAAYPDALPALRRLHAAGLRLAVLTNFELPSVDRTLAHAGLDPALFEVALSSSALGVAKPDPRAYLAVAAALGLPPAACAFVDDLAENVAAARLVGMLAYQIDRQRPTGGADDGRVDSLDQLCAILLSPLVRDRADQLRGPEPYDIAP